MFVSLHFSEMLKNCNHSMFDGISRIRNVRVFVFLRNVEKLQSFHV